MNKLLLLPRALGRMPSLLGKGLVSARSLSDLAVAERPARPLPSNLTVVGLAPPKEKKEKSPDYFTNKKKEKVEGSSNVMATKPRVKKALVPFERRGPTARNEMGQTKREVKKIKFFSGEKDEDRLTNDGLPLLKNLLRDNRAIGNYAEAVEACERRLESGEKITDKIVNTMIRTFGSAGELDKAIECKNLILHTKSRSVHLLTPPLCIFFVL
jgi:pentatricopeptide repeat protein